MPTLAQLLDQGLARVHRDADLHARMRLFELSTASGTKPMAGVITVPSEMRPLSPSASSATS